MRHLTSASIAALRWQGWSGMRRMRHVLEGSGYMSKEAMKVIGEKRQEIEELTR